MMLQHVCYVFECCFVLLRILKTYPLQALLWVPCLLPLHKNLKISIIFWPHEGKKNVTVNLNLILLEINIWNTLKHFPFVDINECSDPDTNTCDPVSELCTNLDGSFICMCQTGFSKNGSICEGMQIGNTYVWLCCT